MLAKQLLLSVVRGAAFLDLPATPLDDLIAKLGGDGVVAEMTGRKERLLVNKEGEVRTHQVSQGAKCRLCRLHCKGSSSCDETWS